MVQLNINGILISVVNYRHDLFDDNLHRQIKISLGIKKNLWILFKNKESKSSKINEHVEAVRYLSKELR